MPPSRPTALVTSALPYANGELHLGHLVGYVQADIWVRAQRMAGRKVHFVCADDTHGTPIMLAAEKAGVTPEQFVAGVQVRHEKDFADFHVAFDHYDSTNSPRNRQLTDGIYAKLDAGGHIARRSVEQYYDPVKSMFLPDRYIRGECPNCGTPDQYGDNCENCGATYAPTDLKNPRSVVSGATPELRQSEHHFFKAGDFTEALRAWIEGDVAHPSVKAKLREWLDAEGGLRDWDISRDAPYFGFEIPGAPGKYFYVWLDAPIGYLTALQALCERDGLDFEALVKAGSDAELHHFLGKDIVNFHGLFWPAVLNGAGLGMPTALHVNGYLTVNGAKMSKSRGTFIMARTYLDAGLDPECLRYYFAAKTGAGMDDLDLNLEDFVARVNSDLVGKFVNIASRCAKLHATQFDSELTINPDQSQKISDFQKKTLFLGNIDWASPVQPGDVEAAAIFALGSVSARCKRAISYFELGELQKAIREIMGAADDANEFIAKAAPWSLSKDSSRVEELRVVLYAGINMFRDLAIALRPVMPCLWLRAARFLNEPVNHDDVQFEEVGRYASDRKLNSFEPLLTRVDPKNIEAMIEASKENLEATPASQPSAAGAKAGAVDALPAAKAGQKAADASTSKTPAPHLSDSQSANPGVVGIEDFARLDLRIGTVLECGFVEGSDKLLRFLLDGGELGQRQIFSGIRAAYGEPGKLVGRKVVFIANLAPRKMRFGISEGMILSAGSGGDDLHLLDVDAGAQAGMPVK